METERSFLTRLLWLIQRGDIEPRHVVVYPFDIAIDIVLPADQDRPVEVVGDDW